MGAAISAYANSSPQVSNDLDKIVQHDRNKLDYAKQILRFDCSQLTGAERSKMDNMLSRANNELMLKDNWSGAESLFSSVSNHLVSCTTSANGNASPPRGHAGNATSGPKATAAGTAGNASASPLANPNPPAPSPTNPPTSLSTLPFSGYLLAIMITYPIAAIFGILWYRAHKRDLSRQAIKGSAA